MLRACQCILVLLLCGACAGRSEERALLDLEVGAAQAGGVSFRVRDGLAAVHEARPGVLRLWAGAPLFTVEARAGAAAVTEWVVEIDNALSDAMLAAESEGVALAVTDLGGARPTERRFSVSLPQGAPATLSLTTADAQDPGPWRFALMSDVQEAIDEVQDVFAAINAQPNVRFLLGAGDLSQRGTREELERFQRELASLAVPYYTTLGNHDAPPDPVWHQLFGRGNFRFVFRGVQFTLVDSASATIDPLAYEWLEGWLHEGRDRVHVFAMHIPALDPVGVRNGAFGSRNEAGKLLSMLRDAQVDVTLYGHIHSYYQFDNAGIPAFISGGGGALPERLDDYERHFMVFDVSAEAGVLASGFVEID